MINSLIHTLLRSPKLHQVRLDKVVDVAVEDGLGVGGFVAGAVVFDHLIGMQHVAAYL